MNTNVLDELKIKKYCNQYGYNYKHFGDNAIITTGLDTWELKGVKVFKKETNKYDYIIKVKHQNKISNKSKKMHFHKQRYATDIDYIFNNIIIPHERKKNVYQKVFKIKKLLQNT